MEDHMKEKVWSAVEIREAGRESGTLEEDFTAIAWYVEPLCCSKNTLSL